MKRIIIFHAVLMSVVLLLAGCNNSEATDNNRKPVSVEVQEISKEDYSETMAYSGTIEESEAIPMSFSVVGTVSRVYVSEGDPVNKGTLLATLNNATYQNTYDMTLATEKRAEDAYRRLTPMYKNGNLPEIKYIEVETGLQQAKASSLIAKKNLDDCNLYASESGIIGKRTIDPGMIATPNFSSITIVKINKVYARISVSEKEIALMKKGEHATVSVGALGSREFNGTVEEVGVMADPLAHSYKIKVGIANSDHLLKPGMVCNVRIVNEIGSHGLIVPARAIMVDETGANYVYRVDEQGTKAFRCAVKIGRIFQNGIEITEGLGDRATVVVDGQHKLVDQASVKVISE